LPTSDEFPIRVLGRARRDLRRLEAFLSTKNPRAAFEAVDVIEAAIGSLSRFPHRGRAGRTPGVRELRVEFGRDGYLILYRVTGQTVAVTRIFHAREKR
jgi:plasmid stabilization system protein ParE